MGHNSIIASENEVIGDDDGSISINKGSDRCSNALGEPLNGMALEQVQARIPKADQNFDRGYGLEVERNSKVARKPRSRGQQNETSIEKGQLSKRR